MDDGESFRYRQNQFYYRKITFDNNVITSKLIDGSREFKTSEFIEKIIVVGLEISPTHISITTDDGTSSRTDLAFEYNNVGRVLVIRRPYGSAVTDRSFRLFGLANSSLNIKCHTNQQANVNISDY
ncbi:hypothetical protein GJ496_004620 [Pomphorhynchus laevis]|nr:hypothetical protein GJ496_004620 [Pomphorhynchus laevis]